MKVEIYVVTTEIDKLKPRNKKICSKCIPPVQICSIPSYCDKAGELNDLKLEIIEKCGGLTEISTKKGYWIDKPNEDKETWRLYADNVEIWQIIEDSSNPIDFQWLKGIIAKIKAVTSQKSQLYTTDARTTANFV